MIGKSLAVGIVIGGALSASFSKMIKTAEEKTLELGAALKKAEDQKGSIAQFKKLKKVLGQTTVSMGKAQAEVAVLAKQIKSTDKPSKQLIRIAVPGLVSRISQID